MLSQFEIVAYSSKRMEKCFVKFGQIENRSSIYNIMNGSPIYRPT